MMKKPESENIMEHSWEGVTIANVSVDDHQDSG